MKPSMKPPPKLLLFAGDGIGPEVLNATRMIIEWFALHRGLDFAITERLVGGAAWEKYGTPLRDEDCADALAADAILLGAVGGPAYDDLPYELKPERGLLRLRQELDLFANLRPAFVLPPLVAASSLKPEVISGLDLMFVRELTGGIYFAAPRGLETLADGSQRGYDTNLYTTAEVTRIGQVAFDLARQRRGQVTSVDKANVMHSGVLWRQVMTELHQTTAPDLALSHMYADNCAMQLVRAPKQFDVIVTDNLFGDLLSDCAAMLTGSLGMLPSASLGAVEATSGYRRAMYEPVHGSAPDIAGQGRANPLAQILSFGLLLRYSFAENEAAALIDQAVTATLKAGFRTADIMSPNCTPTDTIGMTQQIIHHLDRITGV